ncbi:hypothetical protein JCGZ_12291 [Jatropha curcas]|uniref:Uncharacterized protein n=1 Tax=Jatropha curcas TaxID=180498 RepID=A0A067KHU8_JATCU|nr:uncharacterized protein LOC105639617 [Jatropha curcas]KDP31830.1 hypothetical protein JCGZ_12291 [Jatropha curcas]
MGICNSCESTHVATAKLILQDGRLQEFSYPVKVSYVLQKNPTYFICNADEMEFDDVVSAINDDEELQPGQLYFALPLSRLRHPLQPEEMAALAVKASSALMKSNGGDKCGCGRKTVSPLVFSGDSDLKSKRRLAASAGSGVGGGRRGSGGVGGGRRKFSAMLSAIPE